MLTATEYRAARIGGIGAIALILAGIAIPVYALVATGSGTASSVTAIDSYLWRISGFTVMQAILSTLLSITLAVPLARALARRPDFPGRRWILRLFAVPLGLPALVAALGLLTVWGRQGAVNGVLGWLGLSEPFSIYGLSGILIAHVFFNLPLAARLMLMELERLPAEYWKNAAVLGMGGFSAFRLIEWPAMARAAGGAAGLVFMLCVTSFTLVLVLGGGPGATTLEVAIYQALRFDFDPARAVFLAFLQILLTAAALALLRLIPAPDEEAPLIAAATARPDVSGWAVADGIVIAAAVLFVGAPLLATIVSGLGSDLGRLAGDALVRRATLTSLGIASAASLLSLLAAFFLVRARQARDPMHPETGGGVLAAIAGASSSLVLLVPPVVLGAGWFLLLSGARGAAIVPIMLVVTINAMMALPFVMRVLEPAYRTAASRNGRLALSLGITGWNRLRRIDIPALARPLAAALAFGMALSLGDLGAVALFGNESFITLPYLLLQKMGNYRTADAAGLALFLAVVCMGLMVISDRAAALKTGDET
jgi:thiamine ABC transporter, permease protein